MRILRNILLLIIGLGTLGWYSTAPAAQTISGLKTRPLDDAEAERVRIWFPVELRGKCRVTIDIADSTGTVVRHLVNYLAPKGYHNFYWDKRDDSGRIVPAGDYTYLLDNCGSKRTGLLVARYSKWEAASRFEPLDPDDPFRIKMALSEDSALVTIEICNQRGRPMDSLMVDSLFSTGQHELQYDPTGYLRRGNYQIRITIGEYVMIREVTYLP